MYAPMAALCIETSPIVRSHSWLDHEWSKPDCPFRWILLWKAPFTELAFAMPWARKHKATWPRKRTKHPALEFPEQQSTVGGAEEQEWVPAPGPQPICASQHSRGREAYIGGRVLALKYYCYLGLDSFSLLNSEFLAMLMYDCHYLKSHSL